jgi:hypothetical protein
LQGKRGGIHIFLLLDLIKADEPFFKHLHHVWIDYREKSAVEANLELVCQLFDCGCSLAVIDL